MLPAVCVFVCVYVRLQTPLAASVSLLEECVCVCVCVCVCACVRVCAVGERERKRDVSAHRPKANACQGKQGSAILLSPCCIPRLQINVPAQFSSRADHSC